MKYELKSDLIHTKNKLIKKIFIHVNKAKKPEIVHSLAEPLLMCISKYLTSDETCDT